MLDVVWTNSFKKDLKRVQKRGKDTAKIMAVVELLRNKIPLPPKYADHPLSGRYVGYRDCHIEPDWIVQPPYNCLCGIRQQKAFLLCTASGRD